MEKARSPREFAHVLQERVQEIRQANKEPTEDTILRDSSELTSSVGRALFSFCPGPHAAHLLEDRVHIVIDYYFEDTECNRLSSKELVKKFGLANLLEGLSKVLIDLQGEPTARNN